jgi:ferredoxin
MSRLYFKGDVYTLKSGVSVLDRLLDGGHQIPHSCKAGICHACKLQVKRGVVPKEAQRGLKETEKSEGYFLSCQCKPKEDLHVCLPAGVDKQYSAEVISLNKLSDDIIKLVVKLDQPMPFHPGQFVN